MLKTIIVLGANGMLGRYIASYFESTTKFNVVRITRNTINALTINYENLYTILSEYQNAIIINCIGKIPQRDDNDVEKYIRINSIFPHILSICCHVTNNTLIHITTDCVFTGKEGNYSELDIHDEKNIYGLSKSMGEPDDCCSIRTSIIGEELENKKSLLEWVKSNKDQNINGFTTHFWNGITCLQLAKIIYQMIDENIFWNGPRHIYTPSVVSKYDIVNMISTIYNLNIHINPVETDKIDKSLISIYQNKFIIPKLEEQILDLKNFSQYLI